LFHNANLFGSCIIHILYTGCAKIKKIIPVFKGLKTKPRMLYLETQFVPRSKHFSS